MLYVLRTPWPIEASLIILAQAPIADIPSLVGSGTIAGVLGWHMWFTTVRILPAIEKRDERINARIDDLERALNVVMHGIEKLKTKVGIDDSHK